MENIKQTNHGFVIPKSRIKDAITARNIAHQLCQNDLIAAKDRARLAGMHDGLPPYDPKSLILDGQAWRSNVNFGEAQAELDAAVAPYIDLIHSVDRIANIKTKVGTQLQKARWSDIISQEFDRLVREDWSEFYRTYERLVRKFVGWGVGFTFFKNEIDWRFDVGGLEEFKFPRGTKADESYIELLVCKHDYSPHEIFQMMDRSVRAGSQHWNRNETLRVISEAFSNPTKHWDPETIAREMKNNDLGLVHSQGEIPMVKTYHIWVREFTGKLTHGIVAQNNPQDWLFYFHERMDSPEDCFTLYTYGTGNDDIHSIRGLLYRIYANVQISNRLQNQAVDAMFLSSTMMVQPQSVNDTTDIGIELVGPLAVMPPKLSILPNQMVNPAGQLTNMVGFLAQQRSNHTGTYQSFALDANPNISRRTATEAQLQAANESVLTTSALQLFYPSWTKTLRQMVKRLTSRKWNVIEPGGRLALEFFKRCKAQGVPEEAIRNIESVRAVRNIGQGSASKRAIDNQRIFNLLPYLTPEGRNIALRNITNSITNDTELTDALVPRLDKAQIPTKDTKDAELENAALLQGFTQTVMGDDAIHAEVHAIPALQLTEQYQQQQIPIEEYVSKLQLLMQHWAGHVDNMGQDPLLAQIAAQQNEIFEFVGQVYRQAAQQFGEMVKAQQKQANSGLDDLEVQEKALDLKKKEMDIQAKQLDMQLKLAKEQRLSQSDARRAILQDAKEARALRQEINPQ